MKKCIILILVFFLAPTFAHAQALYLSPRIGAGTEANPYRAHGVYRDCASLGDYFVCEGPSVPNETGVVGLPPSKATRLSVGQKTALGAVTGRVAKDTVEDVIWDLADLGGHKYAIDKKGLQHIKIRGRELAVRSAPLAARIPDMLYALKDAFSTAAAWAASPLSETFTCADDSDGSYTCDFSWSRAGGSTAAIVSNTLRTVNSSATQILLNTTALDSADMLHRVEIVQIDRVSATNRAGGPAIRYLNSTNYLFCTLRDAATDLMVFGEVVANVLTELSTASVTAANGDTVEARCVGDQCSCRHNNVAVIGPTTEASHQTEDNIGIRFSGSGSDASALVVIDNSYASNTIPADSLFGPMRRRGS